MPNSSGSIRLLPAIVGGSYLGPHSFGPDKGLQLENHSHHTARCVGPKTLDENPLGRTPKIWDLIKGVIPVKWIVEFHQNSATST